MSIKHEDMVRALVKPGKDIQASLTPEKCDAWHMASCIPEEAGEVFGAVKKHIIYGKELDRVKVVEEMGDLEFYLEGLRQALGITREETLVGNIAKLGKRYEQFRYSDEAARDRVDVGGRVSLEKGVEVLFDGKSLGVAKGSPLTDLTFIGTHGESCTYERTVELPPMGSLGEAVEP